MLLPVCNEVEGIESVLAELVEVVYRYLPEGSEFLIEEGGSTDGTKELLVELQQRWPFLKILFKPEKEGFSAAARSLYERASCPLVFFTDSDGQCVASEFWRLAGHAAGNDFVLGIKQIRYDPLMRRLSSRVFNLLARRLCGAAMEDINFGFRLARREALLDCLSRCREMPTLVNAEMTIYAHSLEYRVQGVRVHHRPRIFGASRGLQPGSLFRESIAAFLGLLRIRARLRGMRRSAAAAVR
jgi:dolichol-phosphate mannosyltransferase